MKMALCDPTVEEITSSNSNSLSHISEKDTFIANDEKVSNVEFSEKTGLDSREQSPGLIESDHVSPRDTDTLISPNTGDDSKNNMNSISVSDMQCEENKESIVDHSTCGNSNALIHIDTQNEQVSVSAPHSDRDSDIDDDQPNLLIKKKHHRVALIDSDSEDENFTHSKQSSILDNIVEDESVDQDEIAKVKITENVSDDESETFLNFNKKRRSRIVRVNSDSEEENGEIAIQHNETKNISEYESSYKIVEKEPLGKHEKDIFSSLCNPESSDENNSVKDEDENDADISETELDALQGNEIVSKSRKVKIKQKEKDVEKMTAKKALEQRKEILAESQRRVRESRLSLPYHKPKPKSLKDFLRNRPKLASPLADVSVGISSTATMKMSTEQLKIITQKIKEREKEMAQFYKSDSESELADEVMDVNSEEKTEEVVEFTNQIINEDKSKVEPQNSSEENTEPTTTTENTVDTLTEKQPIENILEEAETKTVVSVESAPIEEPEKISLDSEKNLEPCSQIESEKEEVHCTDENETCSKEIPKSTQKALEAELDENNKKGTSENNTNIILLSDITIVPTKPQETNKYNLDTELLELASRIEDCTEDYEFNLDGIDEDSDEDSGKKEIAKKEELVVGGVTNRSKRQSAILEKLGELKPRLSVGPNQVLDLEKGIAMPDEISQLRERFIQHNLKPGRHTQKKEMSIMSITDGQIHKETLAFKIDDNEDEDMKPLEKPGVRLQRLREELQDQMAKRRSDLWKEKQTKKNNTEKFDSEDDDEKSEMETKDILDMEEEEDFTDPEADEDFEEDYCDKPEKRRKKSDFVEDEAEESEIEEDIDEDEISVKNEDEDNNSVQEEDEEQNDEEESDIEENTQKKKVLKRIIRPLDEDSDDENSKNEEVSSFTKDTDSENLSSLVEKPTNNNTELTFGSSQKPEDNFATPVTYITGLNNLNTSGLKFVAPANAFEDTVSPAESKLNDTQSDSQNFEQNNSKSDSLSTQDVFSICSGQFPKSQHDISSPEISTQQLRDVFTGSMKSSSDFNTQDLNNICSGAFTGASQPVQTQNKHVVLDEKDNHLISQLIDDNDLENFKKKFESPGVNSSFSKKPTFEEADEVVGTGDVMDSDDEGDGLKVKNRKRKRLAFSDDEESSSSEVLQEETIDLQDDQDLHSDVDYDSEENEVDEVKREKLKASDFFENEAELSESEWGSEDEDERNLDDLEFEKGDEEKFDEDKLRTGIEKLQMKQMLDEDNREVQMLQELLLEDGELHGSGRQRQFRWKNIDAVGDEAEEKRDDDDDVYIDEDESEEQFRKERHKREMLKLKQQSQDEDSLIIESQSLTFTHKSLKIKSQDILSPQVPNTDKACSPEVKQPFALLNKRGSFLSRGEKILQKIAETSKVSFTSKNTNRIVFQTVDEESRKRKASSASIGESTPVALKKLRLSGLSPGLSRDRSKGKSLFENILKD